MKIRLLDPHPIALRRLLLLLSLLPLGCGGHGSSSRTSVTIKDGKVTVIIVDAPSPSFDHVFIEVTRVSLLPAGGGEAVVIFEGNERIDLLKFRDQDFVLASGKEAPPGEYQKIRLEIGAVEVEPEGACDGVKVPSGKIDLNPRGTFQVGSEEEIFVRLDIDAHKSLQIHTTGNGGCIFRPVVFVDISSESRSGCPRQLSGTIAKIGEEDGEDTDGDEGGEADLAELTVDLGGDRGSVEVEVEEDTSLFDAQARRSDLSALKEGDRATLRAEVKRDGEMEAIFVIAGEPIELEGTFESGIADGKFTFHTDRSLDCRTTSGTIILEECGTVTLPPSEVVAGRQGRVLGAQVVEGEASFIRVAVIDLGPREAAGTVESVDREAGEVILTNGVGFRFDGDTRIALAGDGSLTPEDLRPGEEVTARLDSPGDLASSILVQPEEAAGVIQLFDHQSRTFILTGPPPPDPDAPLPEIAVEVAPEATVILIEGDDMRQVELEFLGNGDRVTLFGLIPATGAFDARTVVARR